MNKHKSLHQWIIIPMVMQLGIYKAYAEIFKAVFGCRIHYSGNNKFSITFLG